MPAGAPAALFVNDIINKNINAGHFQAGCMFNFIFNAVGNALRDGSDVQAIPHFDVQGDDQPPFLLAYGNAFFGQRAVAQRFAHCVWRLLLLPASTAGAGIKSTTLTNIKYTRRLG